MTGKAKPRLKPRTPKEIREMIEVLERSGFDLARDMIKVLNWVQGHHPAPLLQFYIGAGTRKPDTKGR